MTAEAMDSAPQSRTDTDSASWWRNPRVLATLFGFGLLILFQRIHTYDEPLERDLTTYALIGNELLQGKQLYTEAWDHKPPAIHITNAIAVSIAGLGQGAIFLMGITAAWITLIGVFYAASVKPFGNRGGLWASGFWVLLCSDMSMQANQPNTEVFINACMIWYFALLIREDGRGGWGRRMLLAGTLLTLASMYKQIVVVAAAFLGVGHLIWGVGKEGSRKENFAQVGIHGAVGVAGWVLLFGYFAITDRFEPFYDAVFRFNQAYAGSVTDNILEALQPHRFLSIFTLALAPAAILAVIGATVDFPKERRSWTLWLLFLTAAYIQICMPGKYHPHYYQLWIPIVVVGAGWSACVLRERMPNCFPGIKWMVPGACAAVLLFVHVRDFLQDEIEWSLHKYGEEFVISRKIGVMIGEVLEPGETFYEFGDETGLYFYSGCRPPTGVFYAKPIVSGPMKNKLAAKVLTELDMAKPELFIVPVKHMTISRESNPVMDWGIVPRRGAEPPAPQLANRSWPRYRPIRGLERHSKKGGYVFFVRLGGRLDSEFPVQSQGRAH